MQIKNRGMSDIYAFRPRAWPFDFLSAFDLAICHVFVMPANEPSRQQAVIRPRYRVYRGDSIAFGPGKAELLRHIAETGSISEAARRMSMSYNRAWLHIRDANQSFGESLVESTRGGKSGGGAVLTPTGQKVLKLWTALEEEAQAATAKTRAGLLRLINKA